MKVISKVEYGDGDKAGSVPATLLVGDNKFRESVFSILRHGVHRFETNGCVNRNTCRTAGLLWLVLYYSPAWELWSFMLRYCHFRIRSNLLFGIMPSFHDSGR